MNTAKTGSDNIDLDKNISEKAENKLKNIFTRRNILFFGSAILLIIIIIHFYSMYKLNNRFGSIKNLSNSEIRQLRKYLNSYHIQKGRRLGAEVMNLKEIVALEKKGTFKRLYGNRFFKIGSLNYSYPYLIPEAEKLTKRIAMNFQKELNTNDLPEYQFFLTSFLRTSKNQSDLRNKAKNPNAALISSHQYGTTFDIYYEIFIYNDILFSRLWRFTNRLLGRIIKGGFNRILPPMNNQQMAFKYKDKLEAILGRVLLKMQINKELLVIYERNQKVFHVTVSR